MQIDQEKLMKHAVPGALHVVLCARGSDGAVGIFYSRDPIRFLAAINGAVALDDTEIRASEEAVQIVVKLRELFSLSAIADTSTPWYLADFKRALELLELRLQVHKRAALLPGTEVIVQPGIRGRVVSYFKGGRIVVKLHTSKLTSHVVMAPLEDIELWRPEALAPGEA